MGIGVCVYERGVKGILPGFSLLPLFPRQVDKGVVPLAGTDGESTTQGTGWVGCRTTGLVGG